MTQDEIIEMARFAGITIDSFGFQGGYIEEFVAFAQLVAAKVTQQEQERCCAIVFGQCESDNVAQRTVNAIRGEA
jgi:hypothetical protein